MPSLDKLFTLTSKATVHKQVPHGCVLSDAKQIQQYGRAYASRFWVSYEPINPTIENQRYKVASDSKVGFGVPQARAMKQDDMKPNYPAPSSLVLNTTYCL